MIIASLAFAYSGFAMLCATMRRQYKTLFTSWKIKPAILVLRLAGLVLVTIALIYCMASWGVTIGISAGWLVLATAAYLVVLTTTYSPKKLVHVALGCLLMALVLTGIDLV